MPYVKITYGSSHNVTVQGTEYVEVRKEDLSEGELAVYWQDAVNEYMADTNVELVQEMDD